jgi:hypothetical protein
MMFGDAIERLSFFSFDFENVLILFYDSSGIRKSSGIHPSLTLLSQRACLIPFASNHPVSSPIKPSYTKTSVTLLIYMISVKVLTATLGVDAKRRADSRPASVASFNNAAPYSHSPSLEQGLNQSLHNHQEAMERFTVCSVFRHWPILCLIFMHYFSYKTLTRDLEAVMLQYPNQSLVSLPANHDIRHLVRQIMLLADEAADRERTPLMMSQKIVQLLYKTNSPLGREVYVALLDQLCRSFDDVAKEAITWLLYAEDEV